MQNFSTNTLHVKECRQLESMVKKVEGSDRAQQLISIPGLLSGSSCSHMMGTRRDMPLNMDTLTMHPISHMALLELW